ncbi:hypothetical protein [Streptomyces qinglanensis]|uniref:Uncharacterized protein n=1 Tax=Streptomyces qinglanensis TaxID=943816 RepID=A0A1H9RSL8_9ACTN|nr:hypothetical protein [Streptomyces qinglanensis]SER75782.1 hypothetical protein SAMN05421870_10413 [Streptomyces qinglanensis]
MSDEGAGDRPGAPAQRLLVLVGEHREDVRAALGEEQYALLLARLEALAGTAADDDRAVGRAFQGVRVLLTRLPLPYDHPVHLALDSDRLAGVPPGSATVVDARELAALLTGSAPAGSATGPGADPGTGGTDPDPGPGSLLGAHERLLRAPALPADEARARCGGAAPPSELIRLSDPLGREHYPAFQFPAGHGAPHEVVLEVNRLLLADIDPWGAAAWWLEGNTWLGGAPASLLGRLPDRELVGAATALVEED